MRTVDLHDLDLSAREELAEVSMAAARDHVPDWLPTLDAAREEVAEALESGHFSRVLMTDEGDPVGWIAGSHLWSLVWEIQPLLIAPEHQRRGHGQRLVAEVEDYARSREAITMIVGTSDTTSSTSISGTDLFADPLGALANIEARGPHAYQFWLRAGYRIVGVVPDAEGPGLPCITLAKRLVE